MLFLRHILTGSAFATSINKGFVRGRQVEVLEYSKQIPPQSSPKRRGKNAEQGMIYVKER